MARYIFNDSFKKTFIETCNSSKSMGEAALRLGMNYKTLCFHAKVLGCFKPNQSGKGTSKPVKKNVILMDDILEGRVNYQSHKLKLRLLKEGYKDHKCEICGLEEWNQQKIPLELHHIDGNRYNHLKENIMLVCPNCHALTPNYRAKNIKI